MKLLVDIGNHRLKWATTDAAGALDGRGGVLEYAHAASNTTANRAELAAQLADLNRPEAIWISCVADPQIKRAMTQYARDAWSLQPVFIAAQKQHQGLINRYPDPAALGSDRWAALVAAADLLPQQPLIVVDAGTAVTVDLLDGNQVFCGGVIFPGAHAMQAALAAHTANLAGDINSDSISDNPTTPPTQINAVATDTGAALANGALLAVAGGINLAAARQRATLPDAGRARCHLIATGGDAERLAPLLHAADDSKIHINPQLVLHGLAVLARESAL